MVARARSGPAVLNPQEASDKMLVGLRTALERLRDTEDLFELEAARVRADLDTVVGAGTLDFRVLQTLIGRGTAFWKHRDGVHEPYSEAAHVVHAVGPEQVAEIDEILAGKKDRVLAGMRTVLNEEFSLDRRAVDDPRELMDQHHERLSSLGRGRVMLNDLKSLHKKDRLTRFHVLAKMHTLPDYLDPLLSLKWIRFLSKMVRHEVIQPSVLPDTFEEKLLHSIPEMAPFQVAFAYQATEQLPFQRVQLALAVRLQEEDVRAPLQTGKRLTPLFAVAQTCGNTDLARVLQRDIIDCPLASFDQKHAEQALEALEGSQRITGRSKRIKELRAIKDNHEAIGGLAFTPPSSTVLGPCEALDTFPLDTTPSLVIARLRKLGQLQQRGAMSQVTISAAHRANIETLARTMDSQDVTQALFQIREFEMPAWVVDCLMARAKMPEIIEDLDSFQVSHLLLAAKELVITDREFLTELMGVVVQTDAALFSSKDIEMICEACDEHVASVIGFDAEDTRDLEELKKQVAEQQEDPQLEWIEDVTVEVRCVAQALSDQPDAKEIREFIQFITVQAGAKSGTLCPRVMTLQWLDMSDVHRKCRAGVEQLDAEQVSDTLKLLEKAPQLDFLIDALLDRLGDTEVWETISAAALLPAVHSCFQLGVWDQEVEQCACACVETWNTKSLLDLLMGCMRNPDYAVLASEAQAELAQEGRVRLMKPMDFGQLMIVFANIYRANGSAPIDMNPHLFEEVTRGIGRASVTLFNRGATFMVLEAYSRFIEPCYGGSFDATPFGKKITVLRALEADEDEWFNEDGKMRTGKVIDFLTQEGTSTMVVGNVLAHLDLLKAAGRGRGVSRAIAALLKRLGDADVAEGLSVSELKEALYFCKHYRVTRTDGERNILEALAARVISLDIEAYRRDPEPAKRVARHIMSYLVRQLSASFGQPLRQKVKEIDEVAPPETRSGSVGRIEIPADILEMHGGQATSVISRFMKGQERDFKRALAALAHMAGPSQIGSLRNMQLATALRFCFSNEVRQPAIVTTLLEQAAARVDGITDGRDASMIRDAAQYASRILNIKLSEAVKAMVGRLEPLAKQRDRQRRGAARGSGRRDGGEGHYHRQGGGGRGRGGPRRGPHRDRSRGQSRDRR